VDKPITKVVQKLKGYRTEVVDTVDQVVGYSEQVVGTRFLEGGYPALAFLLSLGLGTKQYCRSRRDTPISGYVDDARAGVDSRLASVQAQIEQMVSNGPEAEPLLMDLLKRHWAA
jgi:hypothetical protein